MFVIRQNMHILVNSVIIHTGAVPMPVVAPRQPQPGIPATLGPRPGGGPTMSPISGGSGGSGSGASDQEKVKNRRKTYLLVLAIIHLTLVWEVPRLNLMVPVKMIQFVWEVQHYLMM
jgi:hypothetical protein